MNRKEIIITVPQSNQVSKDEAAKLLGLTTYDCALPQFWLDRAVEITLADYYQVLSSFVWAYDKGQAFGHPHPLTVQAYAWLNKIDQEEGTSYSDRSFNVLQLS